MNICLFFSNGKSKVHCIFIIVTTWDFTNKQVLFNLNGAHSFFVFLPSFFLFSFYFFSNLRGPPRPPLGPGPPSKVGLTPPLAGPGHSKTLIFVPAKEYNNSVDESPRENKKVHIKLTFLSKNKLSGEKNAYSLQL